MTYFASFTFHVHSYSGIASVLVIKGLKGKFMQNHRVCAAKSAVIVTLYGGSCILVSNVFITFDDKLA